MYKIVAVFISVFLFSACSKSIDKVMEAGPGKYDEFALLNDGGPGRLTGSFTIHERYEHEKWQPKMSIGCRDQNKKQIIDIIMIPRPKDGPLYVGVIGVDNENIVADEVSTEVELGKSYNFDYSWDESGFFMIKVAGTTSTASIPMVKTMKCRLFVSTLKAEFNGFQQE